MDLSVGAKLGVYEIVEAIGKGGMGEVYRARDTKLERDVAIKILPTELALDAERVERFEREAKLLAGLNHANIATLHDLEASADERYLVMELVEGETLAERIERGPLAIDEAVRLARQIAGGLEAAHEKGVIHRDLKPANIKITPEGQIKILDFGLAKALVDDGGPSVDASLSPTLTKDTVVGAIMGTAAYMSPEQARGKFVDKRTDIWAFGCVLYEMLTGRQAFDGSDASEILAGVIKSEPSWEHVPAELPPTLLRFLRRCLDKDAKQRIRDVGDVRLALDGAFEEEDAGARPGRSATPWLVAGLALLIAVVSIVSREPRAPSAVGARFVVPVDGELPARNGTLVALSPDGRDLVYVAITDEGDQLYHRSMDRLEAEALAGTEDARGPFFSPDGQWVAFTSGDRRLKKVPLGGGPPITICDCTPLLTGSWNADGTIVFTDIANQSIWRVSSAGGTPVAITERGDGEQAHSDLQFAPSGDVVFFTSWHGTLADARLGALTLSTGELRQLGDGFFPRYLSSGHLVYGRAGSVWAVAFDLDRLEMMGDPVEVFEGVRIEAGGAVQFAMADNGPAVYIADAPHRDERNLVWVDRQGEEQPLNVARRAYGEVSISPAGDRIAAVAWGSGLDDVWLYDIRTQRESQLTFDATEDMWSVWTPDGQGLWFVSWRDGQPGVYTKRADGAGRARALLPLDGTPMIWSVTPDARSIIFFNSTPETGWDLWRLQLEGEPRVEPLLASASQETNPEISPDGRWLAYVSDESGQKEVYVSPFPDLAEGKWRVSRDGGTEPLWAADSGELFFRKGSAVLAVSVDAGAAFASSDPQELFSGPYYRTAVNRGHTYDVAPDGQRFVMIRENVGAESGIIVIQNWLDELDGPAAN